MGTMAETISILPAITARHFNHSALAHFVYPTNVMTHQILPRHLYSRELFEASRETTGARP